MTVLSVAVSYCPSCRELTVIDIGRPCAWCDTITVPPPQRRGKPKGKHARVTDEQLKVLHRVYVERRVSVRQIAGQVWEKLGYASPAACATSLHHLFQDRGYKLRSRSEVLIERNHKHGRRRRSLGTTGPAVAEYRRWLKELQGAYRPVCLGTKRRAPGKGTRCTRPAVSGSDYCLGHDPARAAERDRITAMMRARQPHLEMIPWAEVHEQLAPWLAAQRYPKSRLAEATGVPHGTCCRLLDGHSAQITLALARRLLVVVEAEIARAA